MSRLQKKISKAEDETTIKVIERHTKIYRNRIGKYKYIVVFPTFATVNRLKIGLFFNGEEINGIPYGFFTGVYEDSINGTLIPVEEVPQGIINIIKKELRHGGHL